MNSGRNLYGFKSYDLWTKKEQCSAKQTISHWLKHDSWHFEDALLLMLGIVPKAAEFFEIEANGYRSFLIQGWVTVYGERFRIESAQAKLPKLIEISEQENAFKISGYKNKDAFALNLVAEFRKNQSIWLSGSHPETNVIDYYFSWAKSKKIVIPWLDWAVENNVCTQSVNTTESTLIGGGTNFVAGQMPILDEASIVILREILMATQQSAEGVDAKRFRAKNHEYRGLMDSMERSGFIERRDNKYSLRLIALPKMVSRAPQVGSLLVSLERLFKALRQAYLDNPDENVPLNKLAELANLSRQEVNVGLGYMTQTMLLGGWSGNLYTDEFSYVTPSERFLDYESFNKVIEELQSWSDKEDDAMSTRSSMFASPTNFSGKAFEFENLLHPAIAEHAMPKYKDGHLRNAVLDSIIAVFDLIRQRTGLSEDGDELIGKTFSLTKPYLILSEIESESGKNDQKGFMQIFKGVYQGVRNPKAHSLSSDLTQIEAAQYLVLSSLLARRVEEARFVEPA